MYLLNLKQKSVKMCFYENYRHVPFLHLVIHVHCTYDTPQIILLSVSATRIIGNFNEITVDNRLDGGYFNRGINSDGMTAL